MGSESNGTKSTDWRTMILAMLLGAVTGGAVPVLAPPVVRPDPFRGEEAKVLEQRMSDRQDQALSRLRLEMRVMLPPHATRRRILALEEQLRITAPNFRPPTALWHEEYCNGSVPGASQGAGGAGADLLNGSALAFFLARVVLSRRGSTDPKGRQPECDSG